MNVDSLLFFTALLPVLFILDRICTKKTVLRNLILLIFSLGFYAWGDITSLVILLVSIVLNYSVGLVLGRLEGNKAKLCLAAGVLANLVLLGYYKYWNFGLRILNRLLHTQFEMQQIALPLGISFFTFSAIAYLADLYRGKYQAEKNPLDMALFLAFFAKASVGPIERYDSFGMQIKNRSTSMEQTAEGIRRFCYGLGKKILVADIIGLCVDRLYGLDISIVTGAMAWTAALLYALQIYYDFSGYSDMAIGLGKIFGFEIRENFNYPYLSGSVQEFWRRWHISLGNWFRDYLYIPLGGNRKGNVRTYINLGIIFLATGLWHGATTAFVFWGAMHGFFMILERLGLKKLLDRTHVIKYIYTALVLTFSWVIFRVANLQPAFAYIIRMLLPWKYTYSTYALREIVSNRCIVMAGLGVIGMGPLQQLLKKCRPLAALKGSILEAVWCMLLVVLCCMVLAGSTYHPAIYLNF